MGSAFIPVFESDEPGWPDDINGKCLARAANQLDKACKEASLPTLFEFFSMPRDTMIVEMFDGDPDDPSTYDESQLPEEKWFDAIAGLVTVRHLIEVVRSNQERFAEHDPVDLPNCVLEDLEAFERHLSTANKKGVRWHFEIDY